MSFLYGNGSRTWRCLAAVLLILIALANPSSAQDTSDPRPAAVSAMREWLAGIDHGDYAQSWTEAAPSFQKALTSEQWTRALDSVRSPLGKCVDRKMVSALHQTEVPSPAGIQKGDFVIAQFDSSFENLKYAVETVCFEKTPDGFWKASGYYIKPKS